MVNINLGIAGLAAFLGYLVVFFGISLLMCIIAIMGAVMKRKTAANSVVNLGSVNAPAGADPRKIAAIMAALAEEQRR